MSDVPKIITRYRCLPDAEIAIVQARWRRYLRLTLSWEPGERWQRLRHLMERYQSRYNTGLVGYARGSKRAAYVEPDPVTQTQLDYAVAPLASNDACESCGFYHRPGRECGGR